MSTWIQAVLLWVVAIALLVNLYWGIKELERMKRQTKAMQDDLDRIRGRNRKVGP